MDNLYMLGTVLRVLHLQHFIHKTLIKSWDYYYLHFSDKETEADLISEKHAANRWQG